MTILLRIFTTKELFCQFMLPVKKLLIIYPKLRKKMADSSLNRFGVPSCFKHVVGAFDLRPGV